MTFCNAYKDDFNSKTPSYRSMRHSIHEIYKDHKYIARILRTKVNK